MLYFSANSKLTLPCNRDPTDKLNRNRNPIEAESGKDSKEDVHISVSVIEKILVELCLRHTGKRLGRDKHFFFQ